MQIKDMPASERPKEKLLYYGAGALNNSELLALIIKTGIKNKSALQLAEEVIAYTSNELGGLGRATARELAAIEGIGLSKACSIEAAVELSRRLKETCGNEERYKVDSVHDAAKLLIDDYKLEKREHLVELILNNRREVEAKVTISIGALSQSVAGPREVYAPAIRHGAAGIILAHNHPSGNPNPSQDDINTTRRLQEVGKVIGIELLDHIILGRNSYTSLREEGIIT